MSCKFFYQRGCSEIHGKNNRDRPCERIEMSGRNSPDHARVKCTIINP